VLVIEINECCKFLFNKEQKIACIYQKEACHRI